MKNPRIFVTLFLALIIFGAAFGQSDPKADKILKESQTKFKALKNISADFTYTLTNPNLAKPIIKKGTVKVEGNKYRVNFASESFYCDGKKVWVHLTDEEEVTISAYDPDEAISVDLIYKTYEKDVRSRMDGEEGTNYKISVFMLDEKSDFWKAEIWIDKTTKLVQKAKMYARNGSDYVYDLKNVKTNLTIDPSEFVFDKTKFPNVYINNMID